ncbi:MAG: DNA-binding response regulator, partial [Spirochaetota bacterium]
ASRISNVVIVTGYEEFAFAREALRQGAIEFLLKPVDKAELASTLAKVSERLADAEGSEPERLLGPAMPFGTHSPERRAPRSMVPADNTHRSIVIVTEAKGETALRHLCRQEMSLSGISDNQVVVARVPTVDAVAALIPYTGAPAEQQGPRWKDAMGSYTTGVALNDPDRAYTAFLASVIARRTFVQWREDSDLLPRSGSAEAGRYIRELDLMTPGSIAAAIQRIVALEDEQPVARAQAVRELARQLATRVRIAAGAKVSSLTANPDRALLSARTRAAVVAEVTATVEALRQRVTNEGDSEKRVIAAVQMAPPQGLYLQGIAEQLSLSPGYVSSVLKKHTGKSFAAYTAELRMNLATQLLGEVRELTVAQVAHHVGFTSPRQFYRQFKRYTGLTPSGYRARAAAGDTYDSK